MPIFELEFLEGSGTWTPKPSATPIKTWVKATQTYGSGPNSTRIAPVAIAFFSCTRSPRNRARQWLELFTGTWEQGCDGSLGLYPHFLWYKLESAPFFLGWSLGSPCCIAVDSISRSPALEGPGIGSEPQRPRARG